MIIEKEAQQVITVRNKAKGCEANKNTVKNTNKLKMEVPQEAVSLRPFK